MIPIPCFPSYSRTRLLTWLCAAVALLIAGVSLRADTYDYAAFDATNANGNFNDDAWTDISKNPYTFQNGPPGPGDDAIVGQALTAESGSVNSLNINGTFTVDGMFNTNILTGGGAIAGDGTLTAQNVNPGATTLVAPVEGGTLVAINYYGATSVMGGALGITNYFGNSLNASDGGIITVMNNPLLNQNIQIVGDSQLYTFALDINTDCNFNLDGANSSILVAGPFSFSSANGFNITGGELHVAGNLTFDGDNEGSYEAPGAGLVTGADSSIAMPAGTLSIGTATVVGAGTSSEGPGFSLEVAAGANVYAGALDVASGPGSDGDLNVDGGVIGTLGNFTIGDAGVATMEESDGGLVGVGGSLVVGAQTGSSGTIDSTGSGITSKGMTLAAAANSTGAYTVDQQSVLMVSGPVIVGEAGAGTLTVEGNSKATFTATSGDLTLGQAKGAVGYIDVEGAQTTFDASSTPSMYIGELGTGDLAVQDGASAHIAFASIGSSGEMYLSDPGTVCTVDGMLHIGGADRGGSASVLNGALLDVVATQGSALMLMEGISSVTVDAKSAASVGSASDLVKGTLSVGDGGEFQPNDATVVGNVQVQKNGLILPNYCTVKGNYDQTYQGGGEFAVTYTDTNPLEPLTVSGKAVLGGTLRARLFKGVPSVGEHIAIVKAKSITGAFANVVTTGFAATIHQTDTEVYLEVTSVKQDLPVQTSAMDDTADEEMAFSYQAAATSAPKTYAATGLPPGLKIDPSTGLISGVPKAAGVFPVTLGFSNNSADGAGSLMLTVISAGNATPPATTPKVTLTVPKPMVKAGSGGFGEVAVHLLPAQTSALTVNYTIGGSAKNGKDYKKLTGSVTFPPGTMTEAIKIVPKGDLEGAMSKEVNIKLAPGNGYDIGAQKAKKVKIVGH